MAGYKPRRTYRRKPQGQKKFKTKEWYDKKYSISAMASGAWRATKYLASMINSEVMRTDTAVTIGGAQAAITQLNAITQNDAVNGRTGNSILLRNITIKGTGQINNFYQTTTGGNTKLMVALVMDKQQVSDTTPGITDIFSSATDPYTLLNSNNVGRFKIMKRWQFILTPNSGGKPVFSIDYFKNLGMHTRFNGTASSDIQKNGLYLVQISTEATNTPSGTLNCRLGYHDN